MQPRAVAEADGKALGNLVPVLAAAVAEVGVGRLQREDADERIAGGDGAELAGVAPEA